MFQLRGRPAVHAIPEQARSYQQWQLAMRDGVPVSSEGNDSFVKKSSHSLFYISCNREEVESYLRYQFFLKNDQGYLGATIFSSIKYWRFVHHSGMSEKEVIESLDHTYSRGIHHTGALC